MTISQAKVHAGSNVMSALDELKRRSVSPLDLIPHNDLREKLVDLVLNGEPESSGTELKKLYGDLVQALVDQPVEEARVVVFGGGTGLSNIIGGDSRAEGWAANPFSGLKRVFPKTKSVVCAADDGGSTGQLLKDLPLMAIGDIRHVLLSSIQLKNLQLKYQVSTSEAKDIAAALSIIFNFRYDSPPRNPDHLFELCGTDIGFLPHGLQQVLNDLANLLFMDQRFVSTLKRPQCLGNLLVAASIYRFIEPGLTNADLSSDISLLHKPVFDGLHALSMALGVGERAVLPCTATPSQLRIAYANGVQTTGESKSSHSRRGFPVEAAYVDYCGEVQVYEEVLRDIAQADILILAPGSLYSSIIPVFKVPGIAQAVRSNKRALKLLVSNLWVQAGETDLSLTDPERKFRVSDMIKAYEKNIPGGTKGLFKEVLCLSLKDVPASVIQSYSVEGKIPIYLDHNVVRKQGYIPVESGIYSRQALAERGVIQHDPATLAQAVKVLYGAGDCFSDNKEAADPDLQSTPVFDNERRAQSVRHNLLPNIRYEKIVEVFSSLPFDCEGTCVAPFDKETIRHAVTEIVWKHHDIPPRHLDYINGIRCVELSGWPRNQRWDNVYSFYDPDDMVIKIRDDQFQDPERLEIAFLIALGQSLLGDYAREKAVKEVAVNGLFLGKVYHLYLKDESVRRTFFTAEQLDDYLRFARMYPGKDLNHYTRLINGDEGFTPPGLLMGLMYAWYLENMTATHIEYKMAVMKIPQTNLIPEQKKMVVRRKKMISFFREIVFG